MAEQLNRNRRVLSQGLEATMLAAAILVFGGCAIGSGSSTAGSNTSVGPTSIDEPSELPVDAAGVTESRDAGECIAQAMAANDEAAKLSTQEGNLTLLASPELADYLAESWAGCLGIEGVSQLLSAELSVSGNPIPSEAAACLNENAAGDEVALMRYYFAVVRQDRLLTHEVDVASAHLATCVPGSTLWKDRLVVPLNTDEMLCLDERYRSSPEFATYFRAQTGNQWTEEDNSAVAGRAYECLDLSRQVSAVMGVSDGLPASSVECVNTVARDYGFLEHGITADNDADFDAAFRRCLPRS